MTPPILTTEAVAEILGVTPRTVQRYIADGYFPARTLGNRLYVLARDFESFCDSLPLYGGAAAANRQPGTKRLRRYGTQSA